MRQGTAHAGEAAACVYRPVHVQEGLLPGVFSAVQAGIHQVFLLIRRGSAFWLPHAHSCLFSLARPPVRAVSGRDPGWKRVPHR
eukprot:342909-Pyramimonas_sp.AAC.1